LFKSENKQQSTQTRSQYFWGKFEVFEPFTAVAELAHDFFSHLHGEESTLGGMLKSQAIAAGVTLGAAALTTAVFYNKDKVVNSHKQKNIARAAAAGIVVAGGAATYYYLTHKKDKSSSSSSRPFSSNNGVVIPPPPKPSAPSSPNTTQTIQGEWKEAPFEKPPIRLLEPPKPTIVSPTIGGGTIAAAQEDTNFFGQAQAEFKETYSSRVAKRAQELKELHTLRKSRVLHKPSVFTSIDEAGLMTAKSIAREAHLAPGRGRTKTDIIAAFKQAKDSAVVKASMKNGETASRVGTGIRNLITKGSRVLKGLL